MYSLQCTAYSAESARTLTERRAARALPAEARSAPTVGGQVTGTVPRPAMAVPPRAQLWNITVTHIAGLSTHTLLVYLHTHCWTIYSHIGGLSTHTHTGGLSPHTLVVYLHTHWWSIYTRAQL